MAESAVTFLLDKLAPLFENELQLLRGGREEIVYVRGELERIRAFLHVADTLEESDEEVKVWVKQIRDVAHETEDVLDEYTILLAHDHVGGIYGLIHKMSCCIKNMKASYRIASQIKAINSRIRNISEGHRRLRQKFCVAEQGSSSTSTGWQDRREDALLLDMLLHVLDLQGSPLKTFPVQHLFSPPPLLQRLYLTGRLETLPHWIPNLESLVRVHLKWSRLKSDPLESLQALPNLVHLELLQVYEGDTLCFRVGGFKKLKLLGIDKFDELRCVEVEVGALPRVEKLSIQRCKLLQKAPLGIEHLTKLKVLEFFDMPRELIQTLLSDDQGGRLLESGAHPRSLLDLLERWGMGGLFPRQFQRLFPAKSRHKEPGASYSMEMIFLLQVGF
ncbi:hypothetical protein OIU77_023280 [Salix suchowensis]|uniref:Rx N-terminal domain-containing protein n=1 Tax=Salix suchowensis TaxID=1278906 RepID=A0ABQ9C6C0_9ROSI|nr:hypothetical protein OIU77_023280 [Salix suchowensis]